MSTRPDSAPQARKSQAVSPSAYCTTSVSTRRRSAANSPTSARCELNGRDDDARTSQATTAGRRPRRSSSSSSRARPRRGAGTCRRSRSWSMLRARVADERAASKASRTRAAGRSTTPGRASARARARGARTAATRAARRCRASRTSGRSRRASAPYATTSAPCRARGRARARAPADLRRRSATSSGRRRVRRAARCRSCPRGARSASARWIRGHASGPASANADREVGSAPCALIGHLVDAPTGHAHAAPHGVLPQAVAVVAFGREELREDAVARAASSSGGPSSTRRPWSMTTTRGNASVSATSCVMQMSVASRQCWRARPSNVWRWSRSSPRSASSRMTRPDARAQLDHARGAHAGPARRTRTHRPRRARSVVHRAGLRRRCADRPTP